jgi:hypothetical protein
MNVAGIQHDYFRGGTTTYKTRTGIYRLTLRESISGIQQMPIVPNRYEGRMIQPCQILMSLPTQSNCTNFYMFSGAGKKQENKHQYLIFQLLGDLRLVCNYGATIKKGIKNGGRRTCHYVARYCSKKIDLSDLLERKRLTAVSIVIMITMTKEGHRWENIRPKNPKCKGLTHRIGTDFPL